MTVNCVRCGSEERLEDHHILERLRGGGDEPENKEWRCEPCHKYEHIHRGLEASLAYEQGRGQADRIRCYEHRLEILEQLNTPELIKERGTYLSYWSDNSTHYLPRKILTKEESEFQGRFDSLLAEAMVSTKGGNC